MIRYAVRNDIDEIIALGVAMHAESRYARLSFAEEKCRELLTRAIDLEDGLLLVAQVDLEIVGVMCGVIEEHFFTHARAASDLFLYVTPAHRGSLVGPRLLDTFTGWALQRGVEMITVGVTTGVNTEATGRMFERMGYKPCGHVYEWEI